MKKKYITRVFTGLDKLKQDGIYFSGVKGEGEYKRWSILNSDNLYIHCFYKDGEVDGEYKIWFDNGQLLQHCFFKKGKLDDEYKKWDSNGVLLRHRLYKNDNIIKDYLK